MILLKNKKSVLVLTLVALVLAMTYGKTVMAKPESAKPEHKMMPEVNAVKVVKEQIDIWQSFTGRTKAVEMVDIIPQVSGVITKVNFTEGERVAKGDLLFVIDPRTFKADVDRLEAQVKAAKNSEANAKRDYDRAKKLVKTNTISQSNYENRETNYIVSKADRQALESNLINAKVNLDHAYIKSPISGVVSRPELTLGNYVAAGSKALTSVVDNDKMYVDFEVDEQTYLQSIRKLNKKESTSVPVKVSSVKEDKEYVGKVASFDNKIDTSTGTIRARAIFNNEDNALVSGMFVSVEMGSSKPVKQVIIPETAIGTNQDRKFVYVINDKGVIEYRPIKVGQSSKGKKVILEGLGEGEIIVLNGLIKVRPGMPAKPVFKE